MTTLGEIHAEDGVARLTPGVVDCHVCLSAGVGLDVGVVGAEEFFGAVDGELFDYVGVVLAAVVAFAGVALGVFVGKDGAEGVEDGAGDVVFGGD